MHACWRHRNCPASGTKTTGTEQPLRPQRTQRRQSLQRPRAPPPRIRRSSASSRKTGPRTSSAATSPTSAKTARSVPTRATPAMFGPCRPNTTQRRPPRFGRWANSRTCGLSARSSKRPNAYMNASPWRIAQPKYSANDRRDHREGDCGPNAACDIRVRKLNYGAKVKSQAKS